MEQVEVEGAETPGASTNIPLHVERGDVGGQIADMATGKLYWGADGIFTPVVEVTPLPVSDTPNTVGKTTKRTVGTTPVLGVPTALANRKWVTVQNKGDDVASILYDSGQPVDTGIDINGRGDRTWKLGPGIPFWLVSPSSTTVVVEELS